MRSFLKWGPFERDKKLEAIGSIPICKESFSVPVNGGGLEDWATVDIPPKSPPTSTTSPIMPTLTFSRKGNEQMKLKTLGDVREVESRWRDLRADENPWNGEKKVAGSERVPI